MTTEAVIMMALVVGMALVGLGELTDVAQNYMQTALVDAGMEGAQIQVNYND